MTDETMALRGLLEKSADASMLREMIGFAAERLIELEVGGLTGAAHGERSSDRQLQRNGYRERDWQTRAGTVELRIRGCDAAPTSRPSSSRGGWPRRR
jgi:transposase-like protein